MMLDWVKTYAVPCLILLTKCDKLSKNAARKTFFQVEAHCNDIPDSTPLLFSSTSGEGLLTCLQSMTHTLQQFLHEAEQKSN